MILVESLFMFVHMVSYIWVDGKSRTFTISLFNEFLGGLYATLFGRSLTFVKYIYIVLTTARRSDLVEYHAHLQVV